MKAPKLPKLRSSNDVVASPVTPTYTTEATLKASIDDLRSPDSREVLRQHFTGAFPETQRVTSPQDYGRKSSDGVRERMSRSRSSLAVGQNQAAKSSSSSIESPNGNNKKLTPLPESNTSIDIAQAIHLLQELKKTATPEDLVALHKALLPTRDSMVVSSPAPVTEEQQTNRYATASMIRRTSLQPAGLATRRGVSEDILRRQDEVRPEDKTRRHKTSHTHIVRQQGSKSSLMALDLADDTQAGSHSRVKTPGDENMMPFGHYRPGTLRIMNGAASPEPSIATRRSIELDPLDVPPVRESLDYCTAPSTPVERSSMDHEMARAAVLRSHQAVEEVFQSPLPLDDSGTSTPRQGRMRNSSISGIPHPLERDESVPRVYKRQWPHPARDPSQTRARESRPRSSSQTPRSRDPSVSRIPLPAERKTSLVGLNRMSRQTSEQSLNFSRRQSLDNVRRSIDDGKVSPLPPDEAPRSASRSSHVASQMSQQYTADYELQASPYAHVSGSHLDREDLLKRLSTVYDRDDDVESETPEAALEKLTGGQTTPVATPVAAPDTYIRPVMMTSTYEGGSYFARPTPPRKQDSGYGTDGSSQERIPDSSKPTSKLERDIARMDLDEGVDVEEEDVQSLYTMEQILRMPHLLSSSAPSPRTPAPPQKKHLSLLRLTSYHKGASSSTLATSPGQDSSEGSSPAEKPSKSQKKLQKPMPEALRKALKEQRRREREGQKTNATESQINSLQIALEVSDLPEVVPDVERRSDEPETALPTPVAAEFPASHGQIGSISTPLEITVEKGFAADVSAPPTPKLPFARARSKSRGRKRSSTGPAAEDGEAKTPRSWSFRMFDEDRSNDNTPAKASTKPGIPCLASAANDADDEAPMWTDYSSVSRTLGCNPYDISTTLIRRTVALPGAVSGQLQSPHQISTTVSRSKNGGLQGMDSGMASELARLKSRDVAMGSGEALYDRPRMATPKKRASDIVTSASTARLPTMANNRMGERTRSAESVNTGRASFDGLQMHGSTYAASTAESIPPLPELPADVKRVVSKVDVMVSKRIKDSAQPTPNVSQRSSEETPGHSTISVADAVKKALESKKKQAPAEVVLEQSDELQSKKRRRPTGPRQQSRTSLQMQVQEYLRTASAESIPIGLGSDVGPQDSQSEQSAPPEAQEEMGPDWAAHAKVWKDRCKSLGETLGKTSMESASNEALTAAFPEPPKSPAIRVSRYITPPANEVAPQSSAPNSRPTTARDRADAYRCLIGESKEDLTEKKAAPAAVVSTVTTTVTTTTRVKSDRASLPSQIARKPVERARSPGGRVITPSGNYHPFTPADATRAEHSRRAESLAKLAAGTARRTAQSLDVPRSEVLKSMESKGALLDRYGGGLAYSFDRSSYEFGGSAGTRAKADSKAQRKSQELSAGWGVDLSDIPVFLQKVV